jgi:hypothetical protein
MPKKGCCNMYINKPLSKVVSQEELEQAYRNASNEVDFAFEVTASDGLDLDTDYK